MGGGIVPPAPGYATGLDFSKVSDSNLFFFNSDLGFCFLKPGFSRVLSATNIGAFSYLNVLFCVRVLPAYSLKHFIDYGKQLFWGYSYLCFNKILL